MCVSAHVASCPNPRSVSDGPRQHWRVRRHVERRVFVFDDYQLFPNKIGNCSAALSTEEHLPCLRVDRSVRNPSDAPSRACRQLCRACPSSWSLALQKRCLYPQGSKEFCCVNPSSKYRAPDNFDSADSELSVASTVRIYPPWSAFAIAPKNFSSPWHL